MKNLSKVLFTALVLFTFVAFTNAQGLKFGVKAGLNASNVSGFGDMMDKTLSYADEFSEEFEGADISYSTSYKLGFHLGLVAQFEMGSLFIQPELLYSSLGMGNEIKAKVAGVSASESENINLNYLQLPIYVGYKIPAGLGLNVILGAGPYLAYAISGSDDIFSDDGLLKRFDAGLSFMGGVEISKIQVTVGYDLGLVDMVGAEGWSDAKKALDLSSIRNSNIKVSAAYFF